jgi:hypothetical protein
MGTTCLIHIIDSPNDDYACGHCYSIIEGDEEICQVCGFITDVEEVIYMSLKTLQIYKKAKEKKK